MMDGGLLTFILAVFIIAVFIFVAMTLTKKRGHKFDREEYQVRFLKIENHLSKDNPSTWALAVIDGDKLLDKAMIEMGTPGKTMGDRLKRLNDRLGDKNAVWSAHKLRNAISHEDDFEITYKQAATALISYKKALMALGAI